MEDGAPLPTVHNIVATSQILSSLPLLDLNKIHDMLPFSFYDQHKFAAITVRLHEPDCTTLLFSSGKLVVTGCRTWYECVYASLFIAGLLQVLSLFFERPACKKHSRTRKQKAGVHPRLHLHAGNLRRAEHGGARRDPRRRGVPGPARDVRSDGAQLHVPAQDVPWSHLPSGGLARGPAVLLLGQDRHHGREDHAGRVRGVEPAVAHAAAVHRLPAQRPAHAAANGGVVSSAPPPAGPVETQQVRPGDVSRWSRAS